VPKHDKRPNDSEKHGKYDSKQHDKRLNCGLFKNYTWKNDANCVPIWTSSKDDKQYLKEDCVSETEWRYLNRWIRLVEYWEERNGRQKGEHKDEEQKDEHKNEEDWKKHWEDWEEYWTEAEGVKTVLGYDNSAHSIVFLIKEEFVDVKKRLDPLKGETGPPEVPEAS